jgi:prolyl-tRNA synthetase
MRLSRLIGRRIKETPKEAQTASHQFLLRGGYIRPVSTGIYSLLPLGKRIVQKIEGIIREEMDAIDGQEVLMPVVLPAELWEESGRYQSVGPELLRFKDRNEKAMLLGMTHEEAVCLLARTEADSHHQLPFMLYQLQTKYRDEARPRAGLIRVREFTMKDAYSFHATAEDLEDYYQRCHAAYERIFQRVGMRKVLSIESDTGMMGGKKAHEFMAVAEIGEDTIFLSSQYAANREVAVSALKFEPKDAPAPLEKVHTPRKKSIEDVAAFLKVTPADTGKAVFYRTPENHLVFVVIRGDFEVNEAKLRRIVKANLEFAADEQIRAAGAEPGYASPIGVDPKKCTIIFDPSAAYSSNLVVGANEADHHFTGFNFARDLSGIASKITIADIATARAGDPCPITGEPLVETRGIEVGNIFQLGTKYSAAMNVNFLDAEGKQQPMIMGCYGIGVGRAMASVLEQAHDNNGPIWPFSIAPYHVHLVALNYDQPEVQAVADELYAGLQKAGVEVVFDDRNKKAGFAFADADLMGIPLRIILSPKRIPNGEVEFKYRDGSESGTLPLAEAVAQIKARVDAGLAATR